MEEIIRKYNKEEAEVLRKSMISDFVIPYLKVIFNEYGEFKSAAFMVAQYWDDEARDAVHCDFIFSVQARPDISASIAYHKALNNENYKYLCDDINCPNYTYSRFMDMTEIADDLLYLWPDNTEAIPAFSAFTREGGDQCADLHENYSPYAFFSKKESGEITYEVVGEMHRPWLDGVYPDWERKN